MGEETYYIDLITNLLEQKVLNNDERSFNQTVLYGKDTSVGEIISVCKRFPMMSKYQLVIIKEAQDLSSKLDNLDNKLLYLIKHRTNLVKEVLKLKEFKKEIVDKKRINFILKKIDKKSKKLKIDSKITNRIWKNMIWSYINFERRNFKKK